MSDCKVSIGSRYEGPSLDRPCLRQMPKHWTLTDSEPARRYWWQDSGKVMALVVVLAYVVLIAQAVAQMGAK